MEAGFTKGPWSYAPVVPGAKRSFYIAGNNAEHNRQVDIGTVQGGAYSCEANARLIAAAPDLYEALKELIAASEANYSMRDPNRFENACRAGERAIAKAGASDA